MDPVVKIHMNGHVNSLPPKVKNPKELPGLNFQKLSYSVDWFQNSGIQRHPPFEVGSLPLFTTGSGGRMFAGFLKPIKIGLQTTSRHGEIAKLARSVEVV